MKKILYSFAILGFIVSKSAIAQKITWITQPSLQISVESSAENGLLSVSESGTHSIYKTDGTRVATEYDNILGIFSNRFFIVEKNGKKGVIDHNGNVKTPLSFDDFSLLKDFYQRAAKDLWIIGNKGDKSYLVNLQTQKEVLFKKGLSEVELVGNNIFFVQNQQGKYALINASGEVIMPYKYDGFTPFFNSNFNACKVHINKSGVKLSTLINANGKELLPLAEYFIQDDNKSPFVIVKNEKTSELFALNEAGVKIHTFQADEISQSGGDIFVNGIAIFRKGDTYGLANDKFQYIVPASYNYIERMSNGNYKLNHGEKYLDKNANATQNTEEQRIQYSYGTMEVKCQDKSYFLKRKNQFVGLFTKEEKEILPYKYDQINIFEPFIWVTENGKVGILKIID